MHKRIFFAFSKRAIYKLQSILRTKFKKPKKELCAFEGIKPYMFYHVKIHYLRPIIHGAV